MTPSKSHRASYRDKRCAVYSTVGRKLDNRMRTSYVLAFVISSLLCGCQPRVSYLYRCVVEDQRGELNEKCQWIGAAGEKVQINGFYADDVVGSTVGEEGVNCFQIVVYPPQGQTAELDSGKSFLQYDAARIALVKNDQRVGRPVLASDDSQNTLAVALYSNSGDVFPTGDGKLHLLYRIGTIERTTVISFKISREQVDQTPTLPRGGH